MFQQSGHVQELAQSNFVHRVYGWMCVALAVTATTAWYIAQSTSLFYSIMSHPLMLLGVFLAQLGLIVALRALIYKINYLTAVTLFLVYAMSLGLTMSLIFRVYTLPSLAATFIVTSGMFGGMALYGYFTRADLTQVRSISIMALWVIILAMLVNMFFQSMWFDYIISIVGVVIFCLLTAADMQKIKAVQEQLQADGEVKNKIAILGALELYLDFINLFLFLLRFTGSRRSE